MPSRLTFASVLNSTLPKAVILCAKDRLDVANYVNEAQQRLVEDPLAPDEGWHGSWASMVFNVVPSNFSATIITPREVSRIIAFNFCQHPRPIRNQFFEYLLFTRGNQPRSCSNVCGNVHATFERDNVPLLLPFPSSSPQFIRAYLSNAADVGKRVFISGVDKNGLTVLGVDPVTGGATQGEMVILTSPFATSLNEFQQVTGVMKDPTLGPVTLFAVDPTTTAQTQISSLEPSETTGWYRQYQLVGLPPRCCNQPLGTVQIEAMAKLDLIPVSNDTDLLLIQSLPALIEECISIRFSRMDSPQALGYAQAHHANAIRLLNGQLDSIYGKVNTAINVPLFGSNRLRPQPI